MKKYVLSYSSFLVCLFIAVFIPLSVFAQRPTLEEEQDFLYAEQLFHDNLFDLAALRFAGYAKDYPESVRAPEALLHSGESYAHLNEMEQAYQIYLELLLRYPKSSLIDRAQFNAGECLATLNRHEDAGADEAFS